MRYQNILKYIKLRLGMKSEERGHIIIGVTNPFETKLFALGSKEEIFYLNELENIDAIGFEPAE